MNKLNLIMKKPISRRIHHKRRIHKKCKMCKDELLNKKSNFCSAGCRLSYLRIESEEILKENNNIIKSTRTGDVYSKLKEMRIKQTETRPSIRRILKVKNKHPLKHPLKPWQDPESLFCDTEFLKKFLGKEPLKGDECKD